ncbi:hypothetical protein SAMN02745163_02966 [Clostridium cavendishii DSM 21758]|uniref:Uncharacterized protein n=1 Tax=Clostridium cavendishii DSM 21758 TaxID=1121302 RepID=A0A1M6NPF4_9CLOT|nr:hypothetical protein [Clostridium cavendishii]SHJ97452.1 hypothetical protein SAMN02745163_02966 [Clostridium cavendishii DSM 21758]
MPAYVFIQCFIKYDKETFNYLLKNFILALQELGFSEHYTKTHVANVKWELSKNGFMYTGCNMQSERISFGENSFFIRPLIEGYTPEGFEGLKGNWIEFSLMFDEDEVIKDFKTREMDNCAKKVIWTGCNVLSKYFPNTVVYLTDALPWEASLGLYENIYSFDLAIVPTNYLNLYNNIPHEFKSIEKNSKLHIVRMKAWGNSISFI